MSSFSDQDFVLYNYTNPTKQLQVDLSRQGANTIGTLSLANPLGGIAYIALTTEANVWTDSNQYQSGAELQMAGGSILTLDGATMYMNIANASTIRWMGNDGGSLTLLNGQVATDADRTQTFQDHNGTIALLEAPQTWTEQQVYDVGAGANIYVTGSGGTAYGAFHDAAADATLNLYLPALIVDQDINWPDASGYIALTLNNQAVFGTGLGTGADPPVAGKIGKVERTAQSAAISSTKLTDTCAAGMYRVTYYLEDTTTQIGAATVQFQINYTDDVGATTQTGAALTLTTTGRQPGSFQVYLASGNITYQTNVTGVILAGRYALRVRCEYLG